MDKIDKSLKRLQPKDRFLAESIVSRLIARKFQDLNIVKLKGHKHILRVKVGRLRIIFRLTPEAVIILEIGLRSEKTYRDF